MSFTSIPPEIIHQISTYLPPSSLPSLAHLTSLTYHTLHTPLLTQLTKTHTKNTILHRFGPVATESIKDINLEYLRLNGDLHWLQPLDPESITEHVWERGKALAPTTIASRETLASKIGVKFPSGLLRFMGDQELIDRMFLGGNFFELGEIKKCLPKDDGGRGGYMVGFYSDQQGCWHWSLYLSTDGWSCVMDSEDAAECSECKWRDMRRQYGGWEHEDPKVEEETGVVVGCKDMGWKLTHWSWEVWLCAKYFAGWNSACSRGGRVLGKSQLEFLNHVGEIRE